MPSYFGWKDLRVFHDAHTRLTFLFAAAHTPCLSSRHEKTATIRRATFRETDVSLHHGVPPETTQPSEY